MRRTALALLVAAPLGALAARAQEKTATFESAEHGFKIAAPGTAWTIAELPASDGAHFALKVARATARGEASVSVLVYDVEGAVDAEAVRELARKRWTADARCSGFESGKGPLGGTEAPFLAFHASQGEASYDYRHDYLVRDGLCYLLVTASPSSDREACAKDLEAIRARFAFVPQEGGKALEKAKRVRRLARLCGTELAWAADWNEARARAAREKKLVLVVSEIYSGFAIDPLSPSTLFMDADVVALAKERFVPMFLASGTEAPFRSPEVYGLGPLTFGAGILFVTPEGKVVGDAVSLDSFYFHDYARSVLASEKELTGNPVSDPRDPEALMRHGDLDAARKLLAKPGTAREYRLLASLERLERKGTAALAALAKARELGSTEADQDEGVVLLRMGRFLEAERRLSSYVAAHEDANEARFWLAAAKAMRLGLEPIKPDLEKIVEREPPDRWSWKAAAILRGKGLATGVEKLWWPDEAMLGAAVRSPYSPLDPKDLARAEDGAVAHLLATQRRDGSWPSWIAYDSSDKGPDVAIASLAGLALLSHKENEKAARAIDRARDFVLACPLPLDARRLFDYGVWGQIFALRFLARLTREKDEDRDEILERLNAIVQELARGQLASGGWAYVKVPVGAGADTPSIAFVTAAASIALQEAKDAGATVPPGVIEKALATLAPMKRTNGSFAYMNGAPDAGAVAEAASRGPLCALALLRGGKGDLDSVRAAIAIYVEHHARVRNERGKRLCHTSPEGVASYYLLFGHAFAAEALLRLPAEEREPARKALLEDLLFLRTEDGGFTDCPATGRSYGAAMALRTLACLRER